MLFPLEAGQTTVSPLKHTRACDVLYDCQHQGQWMDHFEASGFLILEVYSKKWTFGNHNKDIIQHVASFRKVSHGTTFQLRPIETVLI